MVRFLAMTPFQVSGKDKQARAGIVHTAHGQVKTPVFMPVGTQGSIKALSPDDLKEAGAQIILGNTYHLDLRPTSELIKEMGGLHKFMGWDGPILTDSGGFQAFSLGAAIEHGVKKVQSSKVKVQSKENVILGTNEVRTPESNLRKILVSRIHSPRYAGEAGQNDKEKSVISLEKRNQPLFSKITADGIEFTSHLDGSKHFLSPERSIEIQLNLGSDICLVLDELLSPLHDRDYVKESLERTHNWELRSLDYFRKQASSAINPSALIFGIVQGVYDKGIRTEEAKWISKQAGFDGVSIGGSMGTSEYYQGNPSTGSTSLTTSPLRPSALRPSFRLEEMDFDKVETSWAAAKAISDTVGWVTPLLPESWPRHILGIGEVQDLFECVERGADMFDCVSATRRARNGSLYISPKNGGIMKNKFTFLISKANFKKDSQPIDPDCFCYTCQHFSRAYLRHLFICKELLYYRLASIHNVYFLNNLMSQIRESILNKSFSALKKSWLGQ